MGDAAASMTGQVHPDANTFVNSIQNPFQAQVASIVDPLGALRTAGTLTYAEAQQGSTDLENAISSFTSTSQTFAGLGSGQKTVVTQANQTLAPIIASWRATFANDLATLTPPAAAPPPPPATPPTLTPAQLATQATAAAAMQTQRAQSGQGRGSTILTQGGIAPVDTQKATLLGGG